MKVTTVKQSVVDDGIHLKTEEIDINRYVKSLLKIAAIIIRNNLSLRCSTAVGW